MKTFFLERYNEVAVLLWGLQTLGVVLASQVTIMNLQRNIPEQPLAFHFLSDGQPWQ